MDVQDFTRKRFGLYTLQLEIFQFEVNKSNLKSLLVNKKQKTDIFQKNGIYIGKSGRSINTRLKEHRYAIEKNLKTTVRKRLKFSFFQILAKKLTTT